jgi:competence protein ComEA
VQDVLARLRARLDPVGLAPADVLALLVLLLAAAGLTAVVWWTTRPVPLAAAPPVPSAAPSPWPSGGADDAPDAPAAATTPPPVTVHVAGRVARPGVVVLPAGSRVADAVAAAGGATPDAAVETLNLARPLVDGEQVRVPAPGEPLPPTPTPPPAAPTAPTASEGPLDLNTATLDALDALPGIGPVTAQRILDHRQAIGRFADVGQLLEVPGIGPSRFADLEPLVRV